MRTVRASMVRCASMSALIDKAWTKRGLAVRCSNSFGPALRKTIEHFQKCFTRSVGRFYRGVRTVNPSYGVDCVSTDSFKQLAFACRQLRQITVNNNIDDCGLTALAVHCNQLQELTCSHSNFCDVGMVALAQDARSFGVLTPKAAMEEANLRPRGSPCLRVAAPSSRYCF